MRGLYGVRGKKAEGKGQSKTRNTGKGTGTNWESSSRLQGAGYAVERRKRRNGPLQVPAEVAMFLERACSVPTGHK
jgi:hypothetical protein